MRKNPKDSIGQIRFDNDNCGWWKYSTRMPDFISAKVELDEVCTSEELMDNQNKLKLIN